MKYRVYLKQYRTYFTAVDVEASSKKAARHRALDLVVRGACARPGESEDFDWCDAAYGRVIVQDVMEDDDA